MNGLKALALLRDLRTPAFTTSDAAARLGQSVPAASHTLARLREAGLARLIRRGLWTVQGSLEPLALAEYLTAPYPAYVSLQTALYLHGLIEQIPAVVYVVSLARSHRVRTSLGTFSIHRVAPRFFGGFDMTPRSGAKIATPEKALLDVFYLSGTRSRLFASLPEVELPPRFHRARARAWIRRIASARLRTVVTRRLEALLAACAPVAPQREHGARARRRQPGR